MKFMNLDFNSSALWIQNLTLTQLITSIARNTGLIMAINALDTFHSLQFISPYIITDNFAFR